jgi:hypothetical protein
VSASPKSAVDGVLVGVNLGPHLEGGLLESTSNEGVLVGKLVNSDPANSSFGS